MNKKEWQAKSARRIDAAITEINKSCPADWDSSHDGYDWIALDAAINDAYNTRDQRKLRKAMVAFTEASYKSFEKWRNKQNGNVH